MILFVVILTVSCVFANECNYYTTKFGDKQRHVADKCTFYTRDPSGKGTYLKFDCKTKKLFKYWNSEDCNGKGWDVTNSWDGVESFECDADPDAQCEYITDQVYNTIEGCETRDPSDLKKLDYYVSAYDKECPTLGNQGTTSGWLCLYDMAFECNSRIGMTTKHQSCYKNWNGYIAKDCAGTDDNHNRYIFNGVDVEQCNSYRDPKRSWEALPTDVCYATTLDMSILSRHNIGQLAALGSTDAHYTKYDCNLRRELEYSDSDCQDVAWDLGNRHVTDVNCDADACQMMVIEETYTSKQACEEQNKDMLSDSKYIVPEVNHPDECVEYAQDNNPFVIMWMCVNDVPVSCHPTTDSFYGWQYKLSIGNHDTCRQQGATKYYSRIRCDVPNDVIDQAHQITAPPSITKQPTPYPTSKPTKKPTMSPTPKPTQKIADVQCNWYTNGIDNKMKITDMCQARKGYNGRAYGYKFNCETKKRVFYRTLDCSDDGFELTRRKEEYNCDYNTKCDTVVRRQKFKNEQDCSASSGLDTSLATIVEYLTPLRTCDRDNNGYICQGDKVIRCSYGYSWEVKKGCDGWGKREKVECIAN